MALTLLSPNYEAKRFERFGRHMVNMLDKRAVYSQIPQRHAKNKG